MVSREQTGRPFHLSLSLSLSLSTKFPSLLQRIVKAQVRGREAQNFAQEERGGEEDDDIIMSARTVSESRFSGAENT